MSEIDETTGLPKLPEGHFWRVEPNALLIMQNREAGEWTGWAYGHGTTYRFDSSHDLETRDRSEKQGLRRVLVPEYRVRRAKGPLALFAKRFGTWKEWGDGNRRFVENDPVTPANLLERALETLADWEATKAANALLGDYPPKRFEVSE